MRKVWVLDTEAKGTGAQMLPLEKALPTPAADDAPEVRSRRPRKPPPRTRSHTPPTRREVNRTPLPPGHVRKVATGELGRIQSIDARAGTATVLWLRQGRASTVPLSSISRR
ncbi:MAG: hypothetical protein ABR581_06580 [Thermoleophilaceae bacterium]